MIFRLNKYNDIFNRRGSESEPNKKKKKLQNLFELNSPHKNNQKNAWQSVFDLQNSLSLRSRLMISDFFPIFRDDVENEMWSETKKKQQKKICAELSFREKR
jgi:hypothetical protein